jgi:DNA polymerase V
MAVALIDCDNFFASCERIMQPRLRNVPVAVLSNNDGCVIARTNEVKAAGVTMGQPYHECEQMLKTIGAEVVSANFLLYRGCAKRLQTVLKNVPNQGIEVYSIDESFLFFDDTNIPDVLVWAADLRRLILDWTGILVTIGVAESRALAKVAVHAGKKSESHVADLRDITAPTTRAILQNMSIKDVWGVGRRLAPKLQVAGIRTAWDLACLESHSPALGLLNVTGRQLVDELKGWSSLQETAKTAQKSMAYTRSFGEAITELNDLRSALGSFADSLASKLRRQGLVAGHISVFVRYRDERAGRYGKAVYAERTVAPTADVFALETAVQAMASDVYEPQLRYKKAGVILSTLSSADRYQIPLYAEIGALEKSDSLMRAIDEVNEKTSLHLQSAVTLLGSQGWRGKRQRLSPFDHATWQTIPKIY